MSLDGSRHFYATGRMNSTTVDSVRCTCSVIGTATSTASSNTVKRGTTSSVRSIGAATANSTVAGFHTEQILYPYTSADAIGKFTAWIQWAWYAAPTTSGRMFIGVSENTTLTSNPSSATSLGVMFGYGIDDDSDELDFITYNGSSSTSTPTGVIVTATPIYRTAVAIDGAGIIRGAVQSTTDGVTWTTLVTNTAAVTVSGGTTLRVSLLGANSGSSASWDLQFCSLLGIRGIYA